MPLKSRWRGPAILLAFAFLALPTSARSESRSDRAPLRATECWFEVPDSRVVECYRLRVPETRAVSLRQRKDGATLYLDLPVVIVRGQAASGAVRPDPVVYLAGGPGDGAWLDPERIEWWWDFIARNEWISSRDFIMFDQRGSGMSEPRIDCDDAQEVGLQLLGLPDDEAEKRDLEFTRQCAAAILASGHDAAAYTSVDNAEDLHDLFQALRIPRWNVYGLSYGTRLALEYMRNHPNDIRSVILDSVLPPEAQFIEDDARNTVRAFVYLMRQCKRDDACSGYYPDLPGQFLNVLERLDAAPLLITRPHPDGHGSVDLRIDGGALLYRLFGLLYNRDDIAYVPRLIDAYARGLEDEIAEDLDLYLLDVYGRADFGNAMFLSVQCFEEVPFNDLVKAEEAYAESDLTRSLTGSGETSIYGAICRTWRDTWGVTELRPSDNELVISNLPTLILAGSYDPVTPPRYGQMVDAWLDNSFYFEFADIGHDALGNAACPNEIAAAFLADPWKSPTQECVLEDDPIRFVRPAKE
jgi:pimeloyl-ACP methyl ester carboxylesterase